MECFLTIFTDVRPVVLVLAPDVSLQAFLDTKLSTAQITDVILLAFVHHGNVVHHQGLEIESLATLSAGVTRGGVIVLVVHVHVTLLHLLPTVLARNQLGLSVVSLGVVYYGALELKHFRTVLAGEPLWNVRNLLLLL